MKAINLFLIFTIFQITNLYSQEVELEFIPLELDGKMGLLDPNGKEVIPLKYDDFRYYTGNLIAAKFGAKIIDEHGHKRGGKWGFINEKGEQKIPFEYDDAAPFIEGLAVVEKNLKYGFINEDNEVIIDFQFDIALPFEKGFAIVQSNEKWGTIDKMGKIILPLEYDVLRRMDSCELLKFGEEYDGHDLKYGLINPHGEIVIDALYKSIGTFNNGLAAVNRENSGGFINKKGEVIIPFNYESVEDFSEGYAVVSKYTYREHQSNSSLIKKLALLDSLKWAVDELKDLDPNQLEDNHMYIEYQKVRNELPREEKLYAYINTRNELITAFAFDSADEFKGGVAKVSFSKSRDEVNYDIISKRLDAGGKLAYNDYWHGSTLIDTFGNVLLPGLQGLWREEDDGVIINTTEQGSGALDSNFNQIVPIQYEVVNYLGNRLFFVRDKNTKIGKVINWENQIIVENEKFHYVESISENQFFVAFIIGKEKNKNKYKAGMIDAKGNWILQPKYDKIYFYDANYFYRR